MCNHTHTCLHCKQNALPHSSLILLWLALIREVMYCCLGYTLCKELWLSAFHWKLVLIVSSRAASLKE